MQGRFDELKIQKEGTENLHVFNALFQSNECEFSSVTDKMPDANGIFSPDTRLDQNHVGFLFSAGETPIGFNSRRVRMSAYLIGHITVKDQPKWETYVEGVQKSLIPFEAEVVFRGRRAAVLTGEHSHTLTVVIRFNEQAALQRWYRSEAYQALIPLRDQAADVAIISYDAI